MDNTTWGAVPSLTEEEEEEGKLIYMIPPDNKSDHMQQGLVTLHHIITLQK